MIKLEKKRFLCTDTVQHKTHSRSCYATYHSSEIEQLLCICCLCGKYSFKFLYRSTL